MTRGTLAWAWLVVAGCGAPTPAPKSAEDPAAATEAPKSVATESPSSAPADEPKPAPVADAPQAESLSPADLTTVLQAVLDDPELTGYLHVEKPARSHVKLAGPNLPKDLKLVKGSYPVTIVDAPKSEKDPVLVLTRVEAEDKVVTVAYRYDVEGIRGTTRVQNGKSGWQLMSSRILER
jgi:hypothetical protein